MPSPARAGVLIYAKDLAKTSQFYQRLLDAAVRHADADYHVLQSADAQLIIHAIPPQYAEGIELTTPPTPREEQAFKPFFTVSALADAARAAEECGGALCGPVWPGPGMRVRNVCDPEGNIVHLREMVK